jgi:hypothetical protein
MDVFRVRKAQFFLLFLAKKKWSLNLFRVDGDEKRRLAHHVPRVNEDTCKNVERVTSAYRPWVRIPDKV